MNTSGTCGARWALVVALGATLVACGVSQVTRDRVARSETAVQQAEQTLGNSEAGAIEMQRAKDNLDQARQALQDNESERAERMAHQAELDADLAVAKSQSARARRAAEELQASIQMLRREAGRTPGSPDDVTRDLPRSETTPPED